MAKIHALYNVTDRGNNSTVEDFANILDMIYTAHDKAKARDEERMRIALERKAKFRQSFFPKTTLGKHAHTVFTGHFPALAYIIFMNDGWNGEQHEDIFNAMKNNRFDYAAELLKNNGWKAEKCILGVIEGGKYGY